MRFDKINQKIEDLSYRIKLDDMAIRKASYSLKFSKRLNLNEKQIKACENNLDYYSEKKTKDINTLQTLSQYKKDYESGKDFTNSGDGYLFKCTFPYKKVDEISGYKTSILVNDNVVGLFANGVSFKDIISCLDERDIESIQSDFASSSPISFEDQEVKVELVDENQITNCMDTPVLAKQYNENNPSLIAASKIYSCYSMNDASFNSLNGESYNPGVPTFDTICSLQTDTKRKQKELDKLISVDEAVKEKMQNSLARINLMLDLTNAGYSLGENFFTNNN